MRIHSFSLVFSTGLFLTLQALLVQAAPLKEANLTRILNDVRVMDLPASAQKPAVLNQTVRDQQAVLTGLQSRAELLFTDKTLTRIGANSIFTFKEGTRDMDLKRGTMLLQVPEGAGGAQIRTAAVTAAITGTTLLVEYQPGDGGVTSTFAPTGETAAPAIDPAPASTGSGAVASEVEGTTRILVPGESQFRPLRAGEPIPAGSALMTSESGSAVVSPAPGVALRLLPNSVLRVNEAGVQDGGSTPRVKLDLKEGGVINIISKAKYDQVDYQVATPQGVCAARGTVFAIFVSGGRVMVLGAHGAAVFNGRSVPAGRAMSFGSQRGAVAPDSPEFRRFLGQTIAALRQAADRGLIPPSFLPQVRQQLEKGGVRLDAEQQRQLNPPQGGGNNGGAQVAGGGAQGGRGFAKVVVLEGKVRVFITGTIGESMLLEPGQMIIFPPNAIRLPEPVDIDLDLLVKTSNLLQEMETSDGALVADQRGLDLDPIEGAIGEQEEMMQTGTLGDTNLIILSGDELVVLGAEELAAIETLQNATGGPTTPTGLPAALIGPLTTITGLNTLDGTTLVATNPTITQGLNIYEGKIMTGKPSDDQAASKAEYLFGAESPFDTSVLFQNNAPVPAAAFRFGSLNINGPFPVDTSGTNGQDWLFLVAEGNMSANITPTPLDLSPLAGGLVLATVDGNITFNGGTVNVANRELVLYSRDGNTAVDFDFSGGDVTINTAVVFNGGGNGRMLQVAQSDMVFNGTATGFSEIEFSSGFGDLLFNGSVQAGEVRLFNEMVIAGIQQISLLPAGSIQANIVDIEGDDVLIDGSNVQGTTSISIFGGDVNLATGSLIGPDTMVEATGQISWDGLTFQPLFPSNPTQIKLRSFDFLLNQTQDYSTFSEIKIDILLEGGTFDGNGNELLGIRSIDGFGNISALDGLLIKGGNLNFTGDVEVNGDLDVLDNSLAGQGVIQINGDLDVANVYADGDIRANNLTASGNVSAGGVTSSVVLGGTLNMSGASAATANGRIEANQIFAPTAILTAPMVKVTGAGLDAEEINADMIEALLSDVSVNTITGFSSTSANGTINVKSLEVTNAVFFDGVAPGQNGFNVAITTTDDMRFGFSTGEIARVTVNGADNAAGVGGNAGGIDLNAPAVRFASGSQITAEGGSSGGTNNNGGNGGFMDIQSPNEFEMNGGFISASGGDASVSGGEGGNGGLVKIDSNGDIRLQGGAGIKAVAGAAGGVTPMSSTGGTIDIRTTGGEILVDGSNLGTSDKTNGFTRAGRGGLIQLISNIAYGSPNTSSNRAIQIKNSSELYALTNMSGGLMGAIDLRATGANANIDLDGATLRADIVKVGALSSSGNLIIGNSTIEASSLMKLYGGTTTGNGVIFAANTTLSGAAQKYIRGHTVTINNGVSVNVTGPAAQVFTNVANYSSINGGNNSTTGQFTGSGATTQPLGSAPAF